MACPLDAVKRKLIELLEKSHEPNWSKSLDSRLSAIFDDGIVQDLASCSCFQGLGIELAAGITSRRRLFATCIIIEKPNLINNFLLSDFDDNKFVAARSDCDVIHVNRHDATILWKAKYLFFGVKLARYLRSSATNNRPGDEERNWLINELLELLRKFAKPTNDREVELRYNTTTHNVAIGRIDISEVDQTEVTILTTPNDAITIHSIGFLILDILWFIRGGRLAVTAFDDQRTATLHLIRKFSTPLIDLEGSNNALSQAFEMAWVMIQPANTSTLDLTPEGTEDYEYIYKVFSKIWPSTVLNSNTPPGSNIMSNRSSISTHLSSTALSSRLYELGDTKDIRWVLLRYQTDHGSWRGCRVQVHKSQDGNCIHFKILENPVKVVPRDFVVADSSFIPVYAFANGLDNFEMQVRQNLGSGYTDKKLNFKCQSEADVKLFQEVLTGRKILKDSPLHGFAIETRKSLFRTKPTRMELNWSKQESDDAGPGRIQIWEVLSKADLAKAAQLEGRGERANRRESYTLRFEMAIFSENLVILSVTSIAILKDHGSHGLLIMSKDGSKNSDYHSRFYQHKRLDDEVLYPGLRLLQAKPFGSLRGNHFPITTKLYLTFGSGQERDEFKAYIYDIPGFRSHRNSLTS